MAGYEFSFSTAELQRDEARSLLRAFQLLGKEHYLKVRYETKIDNGRTVCQVNVDGALQSMQVLENRLYELVEGKYRFERYTGNTIAANEYLRKLFLPMVKANTEALEEITGDIEWFTDQLGLTMGGIVATLKMREHAMESNESFLIQLVRVWDETRTKLFQHAKKGSRDNIAQTISLDQTIETYLKSRLGIKSRTDFPVITSLAVEAGIIDATDKSHMDSFHTKRNKAQHQNKPVNDTDLYDYLSYLSHALNKFCFSGHSENCLECPP